MSIGREEQGKRCSDAHLEDAQEEGAEVVEHLGEEVPPHADVGRQIRHGQSGRQGESDKETRSQTLFPTFAWANLNPEGDVTPVMPL
jgi:hypothetical protein